MNWHLEGEGKPEDEVAIELRDTTSLFAVNRGVKSEAGRRNYLL